jgi:TolA-binding protein
MPERAAHCRYRLAVELLTKKGVMCKIFILCVLLVGLSTPAIADPCWPAGTWCIQNQPTSGAVDKWYREFQAEERWQEHHAQQQMEQKHQQFQNEVLQRQLQMQENMQLQQLQDQRQQQYNNEQLNRLRHLR